MNRVTKRLPETVLRFRCMAQKNHAAKRRTATAGISRMIRKTKKIRFTIFLIRFPGNDQVSIDVSFERLGVKKSSTPSKFSSGEQAIAERPGTSSLVLVFVV